MTAVENKKIDWFDKNPYLNHLGFEVMVQDGKDILVKLSIDSRHLNIQQNLHGGVHASMLDTIQSVALKTVYKTNVTALNLNVHYVTGINQGLITANARIIQQGYKIAAVESEIVDERGELIAKGSGVYKIRR
ncbi:PaaI family thioesterase [Mesobacillus maritimus]|uniref:PaaI family thioesterase n=1 Tax=Mesobacillus maritimus TaxID=1643336 RepID=A0ABS7K3H1_9BACI|nr:PaaI family thioesterase [Mesobacillus maritimus]